MQDVHRTREQRYVRNLPGAKPTLCLVPWSRLLLWCVEGASLCAARRRCRKVGADSHPAGSLFARVLCYMLSTYRGAEPSTIPDDKFRCNHAGGHAAGARHADSCDADGTGQS